MESLIFCAVSSANSSDSGETLIANYTNSKTTNDNVHFKGNNNDNNAIENAKNTNDDDISGVNERMQSHRPQEKNWPF